MTILNFTEANPRFSKVALFNSTKNWVNLTVKNLSETESTNFLTILRKLNNEAFDAIEDKQSIQICSLKYQNGQFQRSFPLSLQSSVDSPTGLALKLGTDVFPIVTFSDLDVEISLVKLSDYENLTCVLTLEQNDDLIVLPLPLWLTKEAFELHSADELIGLKKLQMLAKKEKYAELAAFLTEVKTGNSSDSGNTLVAIAELPELEEIKVVSVKAVETKFGKSYVLTLEVDNVIVDCWCPNNVKQVFNLGANIGADSYLVYKTYTNRSGKKCVDGRITNLVLPNDGDVENLMGLFV
jgi:hypothetical protein